MRMFCFQEVLEDSQEYWTRMQDRKDRQANMSFDGYLKLFQLALVSKLYTSSSHAPVFIHVTLFNCRKPQLDKYHMILVDEAQDLTPGCSFLTSL